MTTSRRHYVLVVLVWITTLTALYIVQRAFGQV